MVELLKHSVTDLIAFLNVLLAGGVIRHFQTTDIFIPCVLDTIAMQSLCLTLKCPSIDLVDVPPVTRN